MDFYARRLVTGEKLLAYVGAQHDMCLFTEMKGNIGNHLIWAGMTAIRPV
jgi:hypothetical protein